MPTKKPDVVIDQTTGLPELPDGHAWRIGDSIIEIVKSIPAGEWGKWSEAPAAPPSGHEVEVREVLDIVASERFWGGVNKKQWRSRKRAFEEVVFIRRYGEWDYYHGYVLAEPDRITKANIVERTTEVYREWQASVNAKQEQEEIQGLYPPKTINKEED